MSTDEHSVLSGWEHTGDSSEQGYGEMSAMKHLRKKESLAKKLTRLLSANEEGRQRVEEALTHRFVVIIFGSRPAVFGDGLAVSEPKYHLKQSCGGMLCHRITRKDLHQYEPCTRCNANEVDTGSLFAFEDSEGNFVRMACDMYKDRQGQSYDVVYVNLNTAQLDYDVVTKGMEWYVVPHSHLSHGQHRERLLQLLDVQCTPCVVVLRPHDMQVVNRDAYWDWCRLFDRHRSSWHSNKGEAADPERWQTTVKEILIENIDDKSFVESFDDVKKGSLVEAQAGDLDPDAEYEVAMDDGEELITVKGSDLVLDGADETGLINGVIGLQRVRVVGGQYGSAAKRHLLLYFAFNECPNCKDFMPDLRDCLKNVAGDKGPDQFVIVYVHFDSTREGYREQTAHMKSLPNCYCIKWEETGMQYAPLKLQSIYGTPSLFVRVASRLQPHFTICPTPALALLTHSRYIPSIVCRGDSISIAQACRD
jgi:hypothetical protein